MIHYINNLSLIFARCAAHGTFFFARFYHGGQPCLMHTLSSECFCDSFSKSTTRACNQTNSSCKWHSYQWLYFQVWPLFVENRSSNEIFLHLFEKGKYITVWRWPGTVVNGLKKKILSLIYRSNAVCNLLQLSTPPTYGPANQVVRRKMDH